MTKRHASVARPLAAAALLIIVAPGPCRAQGEAAGPMPAVALTGFLARVPRGSHVRIVSDGTRREGEFRGVNVTHLLLRPIATTSRAARPTSLIPVAEIDTLRVLWHNPNGAAQRGALLLGVPGLIAGLLVRPSTCDGGECDIERLGGGVLGFSIGAFAGALAGRAAGTLQGRRTPALWVRLSGQR